MERAAGEAGAHTPAARGGAAAPAGAGAGDGGGMVKGRSCKGCLYYSSALRSRARGPVCVGVTRAIPQVSERMVGELELEAIQEGRYLADFRHACVGYSMIHIVSVLKTSTHLYNSTAPKPRHYKPGQPGHAGDDFLTKFQRNAGLVANGVAKNLNKVGTYIKDTVGDMMQPYRKRPK
ncbi:unnamed protein product [Miscanthus lutarioriparius]|uniref:DUF8204 domain-containing protein n=1 Tax=Miscanthus lutarioriparius TaxID=422564 RepID=A0A811SCL8_9POAL|nr:unnamed protein product [Miscanthus lutarioriparius]